MRLCTKKELQDDICCGTGCGYNNNVVWSSDLAGGIQCATQTGTILHLTFTPNDWNVSKMISATAVDDLLFEGEHVGVIYFQSVSSTDLLYHNLATAPISIDIEDNDCAALKPPTDGALFSCNNTHGETCTVVCDIGLDPAEPAVLLCLRSGNWNSSVPSCTKCADSYYLDSGGGCTKCSTTPCL